MTLKAPCISLLIYVFTSALIPFNLESRAQAQGAKSARGLPGNPWKGFPGGISLGMMILGPTLCFLRLRATNMLGISRRIQWKWSRMPETQYKSLLGGFSS